MESEEGSVRCATAELAEDQHQAQAAAPSRESKPTSSTSRKGNDARAALAALLERKAEVAKDLADIEETIYTYEGHYLEETDPDANVVLGWDDYHPSYEENKKKDGNWKAKLKPRPKADRLFSNSSVTFKADRDAENTLPSEED